MTRENHEPNQEWIQAAVREHQDALVRYVYRLVGDADRARDVVQDAFTRLLQQPPAVAEYSAAWLFTVCRFRAMDVLRKEGRMKAFESGEAEALPSAEERPGRAMEKAETQETLLALIHRLPAQQQEVIRLKFQNGFSYQEISRITQHSVTHVGVLVHRAIVRLRAEFAAQRA